MKAYSKVRSLSIFLICVVASASFVGCATRSPDIALKETYVCEIEGTIRRFVVSPDLNRVAYYGGGLVVDGVQQENTWYVKGFAFSPDSRRTAYRIVSRETSSSDNVSVVVVDGKAGKKYDFICWPGSFWPESFSIFETTIFSPDSKRYAYVAGRGKKSLVVVDGEEGKEYDYLDRLVFSPDSQHLAYITRRDEKQMPVINGKEQKEYEQVSNFVFSFDSQHYAYGAKRNGKTVLVLDGREASKEYENVYEIRFSPDSKRVAFIAERNGKSLLVVDGKAMKEYDHTSLWLFSSDSKRLIYVGRKGKTRVNEKGRTVDDYKEEVVIDGKVEKGYDKINLLGFSPDSSRYAYIAQIGRHDTFSEEIAVIDGVKGKPYQQIPGFTFSPDSQRYAYVAVEDDECLAVVDGVEGKRYLSINGVVSSGFYFSWSPDPVFSPDSRHIAYVAEDERGKLVVVDGVEKKIYDGISNLTFSPDSRHLAYIAMRKCKKVLSAYVARLDKRNHSETWQFKSGAYQVIEGMKCTLVVDGKEIGEYDGFLHFDIHPDPWYVGFTWGGKLSEYGDDEDELLHRRGLLFDSSNHFHTIMHREGKIFLVEIEITE